MPDEARQEDVLHPDFAAKTRDKIICLLSAAAHTGNTVLVLGALGCGAFQNPPQHMALIFRDVLQLPQFQGRFERVVFAVYTTGAAASQNNHDSFLDVFGDVNNEGVGSLAAMKVKAETEKKSSKPSRCGIM